MSTEWNVEVLVPTHRIVLALMGGEMVEVRGSSTAGTFGAYRGLPGAVHGMIAWPNTVLLTDGPGPVVIDPGYMTQGDMLVGALAARGLTPDDVHTVLATHLHSDHVSALPQLGDVELYVHEAELATPHAVAGRGFRDRADVRPLAGAAGPVLPGVRFIHTPGHTDGHVAFLVTATAGSWRWWATPPAPIRRGSGGWSCPTTIPAATSTSRPSGRFAPSARRS